MNRNQKMLGGIDLATETGIEIGACDKPIVPPSTTGIFYVDHADTATLREKYRKNPDVNIDRLVEVSGVWGG